MNTKGPAVTLLTTVLGSWTHNGREVEHDRMSWGVPQTPPRSRIGIDNPRVIQDVEMLAFPTTGDASVPIPPTLAILGLHSSAIW